MRFAPGKKPVAMPTPIAGKPRAVLNTTQTAKPSTPPPTAQTAPRGTPPPTVMPAGMNPNFKGFGAGPTNFNAAKVNQVKGLLQGKAMKKGGSVSSASKRADGCAVKGKTKGRMV
jgi:hypothetical protein